MFVNCFQIIDQIRDNIIMTLLSNFWSPCEISSKLVPGDALILVERSHDWREDAGQVDLHYNCQLVPLVECSFGSHDASD